MKKLLVVVLVAGFSIYMFGCAKKEAGLEESQETISMDTLTAPNVQVAATEGKTVEAIQATGLPSPKIESALPKPGLKDIQTALKNAGYYKGAIDGKVGPMTKKAIHDFQKANGLEADGKVGRKTWEVLSKHLDTAAPAAR